MYLVRCCSSARMAIEAGCECLHLANIQSLLGVSTWFLPELICTPSWVETISRLCFIECQNLSTLLAFTGDRHLLNLLEYPFRDCSSLRWICLSIKSSNPQALPMFGLGSQISFATRHLRVVHHFNRSLFLRLRGSLAGPASWNSRVFPTFNSSRAVESRVLADIRLRIVRH